MNFKTTLLANIFVAAAVMASSAHATTFKVAVGDAAGGTQWEMASKFAEVLQEKTKHEVQLFPNGQLGDEQATVNDAAMGLLDFSVLAINNITPFSPSVAVLTLPYVIQSADEAYKLTMGEVGKELTENTIRDAGVRILGWSYSGFRVLTNSKRPVRTLDDLKELKVRVPQNEVMIESYRSWGINPTPMAWTETFPALQQKVVDGQDNPYITVSAMKFNEVQKYITNLRYVFSLEPIIVSEQIFKSQDAATQKAMLEAGVAASEHSLEWLKLTEDRIKKELTDLGMEIVDPADDEKPWIEAATTKVWPVFYDQIGGKAKLDHVLKVLGR
ncbi:TRAP transporter substrate-binding protein [Pusillimonas sp. ANT_WB101]|uniref:TRAP transporter substrate-binding protein n=1 Tax=Pusillimonas sp. ANT_WB101 TaxID=2597356 RepID=UPI0021025E1E|nr:TRAP transporter substrate-binding protein [Pusillimonas sp. ANT_WB101]